MFAKFATGKFQNGVFAELEFLAVGNALLAVAGAGFALWDAMNAFEDDNTMAGVANIAQCLTLTGLAASSLGAAAKASVGEVGGELAAEAGTEVVVDVGVAEGIGAFGAALIPLAPFALPLLIVSGLVAVWVVLSQDSELDKWAKHGPFATDTSERMSHEYAKRNSKYIYIALLILLQSPQVLLFEDRTSGHFEDGQMVPDIVAEIYAPGWTPGKGVLDLRATLESHTATESVIQFFGGENGEPMQGAIPPYGDIEWIRSGKEGPVVGLRYRYRGSAGSWQYRARGRHVTESGITLPGKVPGDEKTGLPDHPVRIENYVPGWAYPAKWLSVG